MHAQPNSRHEFRATTGSKSLHPAPLPQQLPIRVLPREDEPTVVEAEQLALLVVNEGGIALPDLPVFDL
jgi:hypothetical protein